jgi:hypothetical protein
VDARLDSRAVEPMKKIPTLYKRDPDDRAHVTDEVAPGCEWVLAGEGKATRKFDGTCTMLDDSGKWWARREVKPGKDAPENFVSDNTDEVTGKTQGWEPIEQSAFAKFHAEAVTHFPPYVPEPGTFELVGPKINGNPEKFPHHALLPHAFATVVALEAAPTIDNIKSLVRAVGEQGWEGIVWHHPDGRMAKLKVRDLPADPLRELLDAHAKTMDEFWAAAPSSNSA